MPQNFLSSSDQKKAVEQLENTVTRWIKWIATALLFVFGYLEIKNAPIDKITQAFDQNSFTKMGLFLFFAGWAVGATHDTRIQKIAYAIDPDGGKVRLRELSGIGVFALAFGALFILHEQLVWFQLWLLVFICVNMVTYSVVIMKRAEPMIRDSAQYYLAQKDYGRYMKLYCAVEYLTGNWQRKRFFTLLVLALTQLGLALYLQFVGVPAVLASLSVRGVGLVQVAAYLPSVLFVAYVAISEVWMKIYRYKIFSDFETIDEIQDHFRLSKLPAIEYPPINYENLFRRGESWNANYR